MYKVKTMKHFSVSKLLIWRQKWISGVWRDNSLVDRRVSPGRKVVVLVWTKYAISGEIKPGILKLTIGRGQSNLGKVFILVGCEENGYYLVIIVLFR